MASNKKEALVKFRADTAEFTKGITAVNKSMGNFKSDLKLVNSEIKASGETFENLSDKSNILKGAMQENAQKIQLLQKKLDSCKESLGENSDENNKLYKQLNNAKTVQNGFLTELNATEKKLDSLGDEIQDTVNDFEELGESSKGLKGKFEVGSVGAVGLGTALGNLASNALSACIDGLKNFASYLLELPEATMEFRESMAKLQGATQQYGYDVDDTNEKMKEMYGYFGDELAAANAITNLQGIGLSQQDLNGLLDSGIAVWTAYGDSIPIESLTESLNETIQVGKVTGALADALNWAGISEDNFNEKLEKCKTTQEKAKLITDTLNNAYGESKSKFDSATEGIRNNKEAQYDLMEQQAKTAKSIEPLKTELDNLKAKLLNEVNPAIEDTSSKLTNVIKSTSSWCDELNEFNETGLGKLSLDLAKLPLKLLEFLSGVELNRKAQEKWNKELQAEAKVMEDVKNALYWLGDVYDGMKNKGMGFFEAMDYASDKWGENTKRELSEVEKVQQEKFSMMKRNAENSSKDSETAVKNSLKNSEDKIKAFNPSWKVPQPSTTEAENKKNQLLQNTTQSLTGYRPSWKISSPNTTEATNKYNNLLRNTTQALTGYRPSWSIPKPKIPKVTVSINYKSIAGVSIPYPSFGITWNAKGGIFKRPTIFATANAGLQGVGEAGAEAILPLNDFYKHLDNKIDNMNTGNIININLDNVNVNNDMDIEHLTEQIAFNMQRRLRF